MSFSQFASEPISMVTEMTMVIPSKWNERNRNFDVPRVWVVDDYPFYESRDVYLKAFLAVNAPDFKNPTFHQLDPDTDEYTPITDFTYDAIMDPQIIYVVENGYRVTNFEDVRVPLPRPKHFVGIVPELFKVCTVPELFMGL